MGAGEMWRHSVMASAAQPAFDKNCEDIGRLVAIHTRLTGVGPGERHDVEVLHRGRWS